MRISKAFWATLGVGIIALGVRLPGLGNFMTVDEENWMLRSAGFYHNLFRGGDTGGAFMTTHPGATTMWIAGAGIILQEARLGLDVDTSNLMYFRKAATLPVAVAVSLLIAITTLFLARLFGLFPSLIAGVLLALEPYLVGMSQITHLDMLLALFMLNAVLTFLLALRAGPVGSFTPTRRASQSLPYDWRGAPAAATRWLLLSGIFAGLAMATKLLPALWLFVFFGIVLLWSCKIRFAHHGTALWIVVKQSIRKLGFVFGVSALTFYAVWPALWFTADLGRSFEKDIPYVVQDAHVAVEESEEPIAPASFYLRTLLGRTTPFVLILVIATLVAMIHPHLISSSREGERQRGSVLWLIVYAVGFLLMITIAAKKADRYALPALVMLPVVAGWALSTISNFQFPISKKLAIRFLPVIVFALLLAQLFIWVPHTIAYNNPLFNVRPLSQQGWGEGLEEAADWLNAQPDSEDLYVASWYPGVTRTFFKGKTLSLSSRGDERVGFVVLYRNMLGRGQDETATNVVDQFKNKVPVHVVSIQGLSYVWVYDVRGLYYFPNHVGELYGPASAGQLISIERNGWDAVEIGLANFSSRANTQDIFLHVRESLVSEQDLRTVRVNTREVQDSSYHRFMFEPIADSMGKTFYVFLESPTSRPGDAVTVRFANQDMVPGEMVKNGKVLPGRDVAYRIP